MPVLEVVSTRFAEWLERELEHRQLSKTQLAAFMGKRPQTVYSWFNDDTIPSPALCRDVARVLHLSDTAVLAVAGHISADDEAPAAVPPLARGGYPAARRSGAADARRDSPRTTSTPRGESPLRRRAPAPPGIASNHARITGSASGLINTRSHPGATCASSSPDTGTPLPPNDARRRARTVRVYRNRNKRSIIHLSRTKWRASHFRGNKTPPVALGRLRHLPRGRGRRDTEAGAPVPAMRIRPWQSPCRGRCRNTHPTVRSACAPPTFRKAAPYLQRPRDALRVICCRACHPFTPPA